MGELVEVHRWDGEGYRPLVFSDGWMAALLNWEPIMGLKKATDIERHKETDEVFVLMKGHAALYVVEAEGLRVIELDPGLIYNVTKGTWHNLLATHDSTFLIVENRGTHLHDTETRKLNPSELESLENQAPAWTH
jgi:mannose-6-phosphate isomerase-like protein (cupin superfamily)